MEETFAGQLERRLTAATTSRVQLVNAGVDGYGPDQSYLRMRKEIPRFRPALVVLVVFADNDAGDLIRNKLIRLDSEGQLKRQAFAFTEELKQHYARRQKLDNMPAFAADLVDPQLLKRDLRILLERRLGMPAGWLRDVTIDTSYRTARNVDWIEVWRKRSLNEFAEYMSNDGLLRLDNIQSDHYDADVAVQPTEHSSRYKLRCLLDAVLAETIEFLRAQGIPLVLAIVPSPIDACIAYDWQVDLAKYPKYDRRILSDAVAETSRRLDAVYVNLSIPSPAAIATTCIFTTATTTGMSVVRHLPPRSWPSAFAPLASRRSPETVD